MSSKDELMQRLVILEDENLELLEENRGLEQENESLRQQLQQYDRMDWPW